MQKEMRQVLCESIIKVMKKNTKVMLIDADLGKANGTLPIGEVYPDRYIDVGVAEQNMTSIAAGIASYGNIPIITTFAAFASRRICDQIAISISYANQNVKIIGTDPGIAAELNGGTHMAIEDIGVLRSIPNILIFEPADTVELSKALPMIIEYKGPVYMRMYRKKVDSIYNESYSFNLLKADVLKQGKDVTLISSGLMVSEAVKASAMLLDEGINAEVINLHTIKPIDEDTVLASAKKTGAIVTCDNHNVIGGLRSAVAEVVTEKYPAPIIPVGIQNINGEVGTLL
ncbi:MAG: transketolase family protein, partial [Clostridia bacterium]|nr:transketolase family protein [Clostridia bacterium]